ncbi:MAG: Transcriptional regulator, TetR family [Solirubrobacterales bacterium]|nr:Transcriptional regulator, TetR family [Solirubrobacterales bacterium]
MSRPAARPVARPVAAKLSLEVLVDAAARIAVAEGVEAVSMRRLAERCGVGVMTLYGYVRTKEELLGALADRFLAEIRLPPPDAPWAEQLAVLFGSVREVMLAHPALIPIVATQRIDGAAAYRGAEVVFAALYAEGVPDGDVLAAFSALTAFTIGCVQREAGVSPEAGAVLPALAALPPDEFPHVVSLTRALVSRDPARDFADGLRLIIDGIAARVPAR